MLYKFIFALNDRNFEKGQMVIKRYEQIESIIFVAKGVLEVFTEIDGIEFVLERLHPGSCLNYRSFFRQDIMEANVRCLENCKLFYLTQEIFDQVLIDSQKSKKNLEIFKMKLFD